METVRACKDRIRLIEIKNSFFLYFPLIQKESWLLEKGERIQSDYAKFLLILDSRHTARDTAGPTFRLFELSREMFNLRSMIQSAGTTAGLNYTVNRCIPRTQLPTQGYGTASVLAHLAIIIFTNSS